MEADEVVVFVRRKPWAWVVPMWHRLHGTAFLCRPQEVVTEDHHQFWYDPLPPGGDHCRNCSFRLRKQRRELVRLIDELTGGETWRA